MPGITIRRYLDDKVLYEAPQAETVKEAVEQAVADRANLSGANLVRANLVRANLGDANLIGAHLIGARLPTGETWAEYLTEVVPALLTAGGKELAAVATKEHWDCHTWSNCPMAAAFGTETLSGVPALLRPRAQQFIQLFDAGLIPLDAVLGTEATS